MARDTDELIAELAADLRPVRRWRHPVLRAVSWLAIVAAIGVILALRTDLAAMALRVSAFPDMWLAVCGSCLTAILAAITTFQISLPDRSGWWTLLPAPALALWVGASGLGCLRNQVIGATRHATLQTATQDCLPFILGLSLPLAAALWLLIFRTRPLRPGLVATMGGLATSAAAASLLWLVHPFDASAADLLVHVLAVGLVVLAARLAGPRVLTANEKSIPT